MSGNGNGTAGCVPGVQVTFTGAHFYAPIYV